MVALTQGEIWWAELPEAVGSEPGFRRPVVVVQGNPLNRSRIKTAVCVPLTTNLVWAEAPGSALLPASTTGLQRDSVAKATQLLTLERSCLVHRVGRLESRHLAQILHGIDVVLGR